MRRIREAEALLLRLEGGLLVAILSFMVVMSFAQVVLRQLFGTGLLWADTLLRHLVLWVGFLGASLAAAQGKHFAWEPPEPAPAGGAKPPAGTTLPCSGSALRRLAAQLCAALVAALLVKASWRFLLEERAAGAVLFHAGPVAAPAWIFAAIIPAGFALVGLHLLLRALEAAARLCTAAPSRHEGRGPR